MRKLVASTSVKGGSLLLLLSVFGMLGTTHFRSLQRSAAPARRGSAVAQRSGAASLAGLPLVAQAKISATLGRDLPTYRVRQMSNDGTALVAENRRNKLSADFTRAGVTVRSGNGRWTMALRGYGYGDDLEAVADVAPRASDNRVEYRRGALVEWYVNGPLGLEQGFTLTRTPKPGPRSPNSSLLTIALRLPGGATATVDRDGRGVTLSRAGSAEKLRYMGLTASDSTGKQLKAHLEIHESSLLLRVEDANARYPVVIDPFVQLAELTASTAATSTSSATR